MEYIGAVFLIVGVLFLFVIEAVGFMRWVRKKFKQFFCHHVNQYGYTVRGWKGRAPFKCRRCGKLILPKK